MRICWKGPCAGKRAVDAHLVPGDREITHVVGGHRARAALERDQPHRLEAEHHPHLAAVRQGVWPLNAEPDSASLITPSVWHPGGVGAGVPLTVSENVPDTVVPAASVTVTVNVVVPNAELGLPAPDTE